MSEDVKSAANSYENFTTSGDPLYKLVSKIGSVAGTAGVCGEPDARLVAERSIMNTLQA